MHFKDVSQFVVFLSRSVWGKKRKSRMGTGVVVLIGGLDCLSGC